MTAIEKKIKGEKKSKFIFIIIASIIIYYASSNHIDLLYTISTATLFFIGVFIDPIIPLCLKICTAPYELETNSFISLFYWVIVVFPVFYRFCLKSKDKLVVSNQTMVILLLSIILFIASYITGIETMWSTVIVQMLIIMCYLGIRNMANESSIKLLIFSFVFQGILMLIVVSLQILDGSVIWLWGRRLTYNGSVRTLSSTLAFACVFFFISFIREKEHFFKKIIYAFVSLLFTVFIILTYSRGVLIALILTFFVFLFYNNRRMRLLSKISLIIVFAVLLLVINGIGLDYEMMFNDINTGSGRFEIWLFYFQRMVEGGFLRLLLGFGPGNLTRIVSGTAFESYYSHSVFFDYLFSYGVLGLFIPVYFVISFIITNKTNKNGIALSVFLLTITMYFSHGNSASLEFHALLAMACSISKINYLERRKIQ